MSHFKVHLYTSIIGPVAVLFTRYMEWCGHTHLPTYLEVELRSFTSPKTTVFPTHSHSHTSSIFHS
jgi:hypothetical protein